MCLIHLSFLFFVHSELWAYAHNLINSGRSDFFNAVRVIFRLTLNFNVVNHHLVLSRWGNTPTHNKLLLIILLLLQELLSNLIVRHNNRRLGYSR